MSGIILMTFDTQSFTEIQSSLDDASATPGAVFLKERSFDKLFRHWDRKVKRRLFRNSL